MMKTILLFSRDPGGANTIIPLVQKLNDKYNILLYGKDVALLKYKDNNLNAQNIMEYCKNINYNEIKNFLINIKPDFIITGTSADDYTEKYLWAAGQELNIKSFAILDQWINYGIRFSKYSVSEINEYNKYKTHEYMPSKILVMDSFAKDQMIKEGIDKSDILISGQPYFDFLYNKLKNVSFEECQNYRKKLNCTNDTIVITYVSEPFSKFYNKTENMPYYWGYTEKTIFNSLKQVLNELATKYNKKFKVIIRLHPKEDKNSFDDLIKENGNLSFVIDNYTNSDIIINSSDLICGMQSMFLIESAIIGKPILSIQIGLRQDNPFILNKKNIIKEILTKEDLKLYLENFLDGNLVLPKLDIEYGAVDNVINFMEEFL